MMLKDQIKYTLNQFNLSDTDKERIIRNCIKEKHVQNRVFLHSKQIAAVLAVGVFCTTSLTTFAAVNAYREYMEKMSAEEIQTRYQNIQESKRDADSFSRLLTDAEHERIELLKIQYQQGLIFPQNPLVSFDGTADARPENVSVSYDYANTIFYIPESELTDEELLQIIDVWERGNYSLQAVNNEILKELTEDEIIANAKAEMAKHTKDVPVLMEDAIRQNAILAVESVSGEDASCMDWEIVLYGDHNPKYVATVRENGSMQFRIVYTPYSAIEHLEVYQYTAYTDRQGDQSITEAKSRSEKQMLELISGLTADAKETLKDSFGVDENIVKCEYGYSKNVLSGEMSFVVISLATDSGDRYSFNYNLNDMKIHEMLKYEAETYSDVDFISCYDVHGSIIISDSF